MLKTQAEISRLKGVSRLIISRYIAKHNIAPAGKKGKLALYDCTKEPLTSYLSGGPASEKKPQKTVSQGAEQGPFSASPAASHDMRISKPLNDLLAGKVPEGVKPSSAFYAKAMRLAEENHDAALLFKLGQIADKEDRDELYQQQMIKTEQAKEQIAQEKAERLKIENEIRRGEYMDRQTVKLLFGKTYAVHTSVLTPLGLKLSDMLNALPSGPDRRNKIQDMIDDEIFSALEGIKRLLLEFVNE